MASPLHPELATADIRTQIEAGFRHWGILERAVVVEHDNGEEELTGWELVGEPFSCHLLSAGRAAVELAAARGFQIQWELKMGLLREVYGGNRVLVRGASMGRVAWQRLVSITGELGETNKATRLLAAVDADLSP